MFDNKTTGEYYTFNYGPTTTDSALSQIFTMATLKTNLGYLVGDYGQDIKARIIAINTYGSSDASDYNDLTAVIQGPPPAYTGTITPIVTETSIEISWPEIITPSSYGHNAVSGWAVGYKKTIDASYVMYEITSASTRSKSYSPLIADTEYKFFVEPLNAF